MVRSDYSLFIQEPKNIVLNHSIPQHLRGIESIDELRTVDLGKLSCELVQAGSSLKEKVGDGTIWRMGFPGMILDVAGIYQNGTGDVTFDVSPIHPYRADLAYRGDQTLPRRVAPLTVGSIIFEKTGRPVLGIRGGDVENGTVDCFPGGHVDFGYDQSRSVLPYMSREFYEELGREIDTSRDNLRLLGFMDNRDTGGINVLYSIKTTSSFEEIRACWEKAKDRVEHSSVFLSSDSELKRLGGGKEILHEGSSFRATPFFADCFANYLVASNS